MTLCIGKAACNFAHASARHVLLGALPLGFSTSGAGVVAAIALGVVLEGAQVRTPIAAEVDPDVTHVAADPISGYLITAPTDCTVVACDICWVGLLIIQKIQLVVTLQGIAHPCHPAATPPTTASASLDHGSGRLIKACRPLACLLPCR